MRKWCYAGGVCALLGTAAIGLGQQSSVFRGTATGQSMQFRKIDTSKTIAPVPAYGAPKKSFSLKSLVPGWLRSDDTPQPTSMRAMKRPSTQSTNTSSSGSILPSQPFAQQK